MTTSRYRSVATERIRASMARRPDFHWNPPVWVPIAFVLVALATHVAVAWSAEYPRVSLDELVMVGYSHLAAGAQGDWLLEDMGFMPGLGLLMAPLWWFTDDPVLVYRLGIWLTVALSMLSLWPLSALAMRVGASRNAAVAISAVVIVAPARSLISNYLLSESLLVLTTATVLVLAARLSDRERYADAVLLGLAVGAAVLSHGRGVALALAIGIWTLTMVARRPKVYLIAGATAFVASLSAYAIYTSLTARLLVNDTRVSQTLGSAPDVDPIARVAALIGELWYPVLAWPAVVLFGALWVLGRLRADPWRRLLVLASLLTISLSLWQMNPGPHSLRPDVWYYGRYNDHLWTILAVIGLTVALRLRWPKASLAVVGGAALVSALMLVITVPRITTDGFWTDLHSMGISPWLSLDDFVSGRPQPWLLLCAFAVGLTAFVLAFAWFRATVLPVLLAFWAGLSVAHDAMAIDVRIGGRSGSVDYHGLQSLPEGIQIGVDENLGLTQNFIYFASGDHPVVRVDMEDVPDDVEVVYSAFINADAPADGARMLTTSAQMTVVAWVYPGELYNELDAEGLLVTAED